MDNLESILTKAEEVRDFMIMNNLFELSGLKLKVATSTKPLALSGFSKWKRIEEIYRFEEAVKSLRLQNTSDSKQQ